MSEINAAELTSELGQFTGTEQYHRTSPLHNVVLTDGWKHLAEKAGAYWLADVVGSWQPALRKKGQDFIDFQCWTIKVNPDRSCVVSCTDGNYNKGCSQSIPYTDFPLNEFEWYVQPYGKWMVMMLKSEY